MHRRTAARPELRFRNTGRQSRELSFQRAHQTVHFQRPQAVGRCRAFFGQISRARIAIGAHRDCAGRRAAFAQFAQARSRCASIRRCRCSRAARSDTDWSTRPAMYGCTPAAPCSAAVAASDRSRRDRRRRPRPRNGKDHAGSATRPAAAPDSADKRGTAAHRDAVSSAPAPATRFSRAETARRPPARTDRTPRRNSRWPSVLRNPAQAGRWRACWRQRETVADDLFAEVFHDRRDLRTQQLECFQTLHGVDAQLVHLAQRADQQARNGAGIGQRQLRNPGAQRFRFRRERRFRRHVPFREPIHQSLEQSAHRPPR